MKLLIMVEFPLNILSAIAYTILNLLNIWKVT